MHISLKLLYFSLFRSIWLHKFLISNNSGTTHSGGALWFRFQRNLASNERIAPGNSFIWCARISDSERAPLCALLRKCFSYLVPMLQRRNAHSKWLLVRRPTTAT